ncbi:cold-shock protein [Wolbachia endosymbiont of Pentalonia nigronervosa]|jgi:CspA family cold shock protein|uniref:cold-shock protein n=1 Tax=Wolbachia endosymbiont of Pentalonia nigronervosa TaxID=1301914 RepID=UPI00165FAEC6|nr:cold-shock protein [Wolbachia endosymbiont of Pentalonia nigronervosa]MBD0391307.1 cold-shock protein [Wolbachia endosymbiont of Pentalonia nigronervosa]
MELGKLKWFNVEKGYGFISPSNGSGDDVFVHISTLNDAKIDPSTFKEGQRVSFDLTTNKQGKVSAINLKLIADGA